MKKWSMILAAVLVLCLVLAGCREENVFAGTEGLWRLDGEEGTASVAMDGQGNFVSYYGSGAEEAKGTLKAAEGRFEMIGQDGQVFNSFVLESENQLKMGTGDVVFSYIRAEK